MRFIAQTMAKYFEATNSNNMLHHETPPELMPLVQDLDQIFHDHFFGGTFEFEALAAPLCMNAYTLFLSGVRQALSGHVAATFPLLRSAIESACYAHRIQCAPELADVWVNRHKDEQSFRASKKRFGSAVSETVKALAALDEQAAAYVQAMYDASIDYGAHPNPKSVLNHLSFAEETEIEARFELAGVYGEHSYQVNLALLAAAEAGFACLFIIAALIPDHVLLQGDAPVLNGWMDRKNALADHLNGGPVEYSKALYTQFPT